MNTMRRMRFGILAAAVALAVGWSSAAQAAYTYSSSIVINSVGGSGGVIVNTPGTGATFTSTGGSVISLSNIGVSGSFLVPSTNSVNIGNITVSTTDATPDTFSVNYLDTITITNPSGGTTGTFAISGSLALSALQFTGGASAGNVSNQYNSVLTLGPTTIGGNDFTVNFGNGSVNNFFGQPTVNNAAAGGNFGAVITAAVPEPASIGVLVAFGVGAIRRRRMI